MAASGIEWAVVMRAGARVWVLCCALACCGGCVGQVEVAVQMSTDLAPGVDFDRVVLSSEAGELASRGVDASVRFDRPQPIATLGGIARGSTLRLVATLESRGAPILTRTATFRADTSRIVTFVFSSACRSVRCPPADDALATECEDGRCVRPMVCEECLPDAATEPLDGGMSDAGVVEAPLGAECSSDAQCASRRCYPASTLGLERAVCSSPCCSDSDCPSGTYCAANGSGARGCLPGEAAGACARPADCGAETCRLEAGRLSCGPAAGGGATGSLCAEGSECATALCAMDVCVDPCGSDADCREPTSCRIVGSAGSFFGACLPGATGEADGATCDSNLDCRSGACFLARCSALCCTDAHCGTGEVCRPLEFGGWEMRCAPVSPG